MGDEIHRPTALPDPWRSPMALDFSGEMCIRSSDKGISPELSHPGPQLGLDAQWIAVEMRITRHRRR